MKLLIAFKVPAGVFPSSFVAPDGTFVNPLVVQGEGVAVCVLNVEAAFEIEGAK